MVSTFSPNIDLEKPGRGDDIGTWDTPVNSNMSIIDSKLGTVQSISLAGGSITLSNTQAQSAFLNFNGVLPSNVTVTIPGLSSAPGTTVSGYFYTVQNQCAASSAYTVTIATTVAGQQSIGIPPFECVDIMVEGTGSSQAGSIKFRSLGRIGTFWDYGGSSVPNWVSACSLPPYLNCDGTTFSSASYPALTVILGGTTLPDSKGRFRATLNQGSGRLTDGVNANTNLAGGGTQYIARANLPSTTVNITLSNGTGTPTAPDASQAQNTAVSGGTIAVYTTNRFGTVTGSFTLGGDTGYAPPSYVGGITMIRAA